ncbi:hypothetical protein H9L39_03264 [Fusarium oxysporum f. sp. albedinis]|nr:hypothetical protein H9L39_03264 [Fusarium oxysporum f. sp. albedinis]
MQKPLHQSTNATLISRFQASISALARHLKTQRLPSSSQKPKTPKSGVPIPGDATYRTAIWGKSGVLLCTRFSKYHNVTLEKTWIISDMRLVTHQ